jgi:hypothetical protein
LGGLAGDETADAAEARDVIAEDFNEIGLEGVLAVFFRIFNGRKRGCGVESGFEGVLAGTGLARGCTGTRALLGVLPVSFGDWVHLFSP